MRPQIGGMPFHMFLNEGEEGKYVARLKKVQKRLAGDDSLRHNFPLSRRPTGRAANPAGSSLVKPVEA